MKKNKIGWIVNTHFEMFGSFDHLYYTKKEAVESKKVMDCYKEKLKIIKVKICQL